MDAAESIKANGKTLDDTTPQGRAIAASIDDMVKSWNNLDAASQQSKGGIRAAREAITSAVNAAGGGKAEIDKFAGSLKTVTSPPPIGIKFKGIAGSIEAAGALGVALDRLHDKTINVKTIRTGVDAGGAIGLGGFTGMRIPDGYADGGRPMFSGRVPGTRPLTQQWTTSLASLRWATPCAFGRVSGSSTRSSRTRTIAGFLPSTMAWCSTTSSVAHPSLGSLPAAATRTSRT